MKTLLPILILTALLCSCAAPALVKPVVVMPPAPPSAAFTVNAIQTPPPPVVSSYGVMTMLPYYNANPGTYFLQGSTDLIAWSLIATNELDQPLTVTDAIPSPLKFYRTGFGSLTAQ